MLTLSSPDTMGQLKSRHDTIDDLNALRARCLAGLPSRVRKFTPAVLKAICPAADGKKDVMIGTAELACTYIRISLAGHASYCVQHRAIGRKTIGDVRLWSTPDAMRRARELLHGAHLGRDVVAEEETAAREKANETTIGKLIDWYLAEPEVKKLRSYTDKTRYLRVHWKPLHAEPAEHIERSRIIPVLRRIARDSGPNAANQARSNLGAMFSFALKHGELKREHSPCGHLPTWKERERSRYFSREEIPLLVRTSREVSEVLAAEVELMLHTGLRRQAVAGLRVSEINLAENRIELPKERCKNGLEFIVPMSPRVRAIIEEWLPRARPSGRLFPHVREGDLDKKLHEKLEALSERHRVEKKLNKQVLFEPILHKDGTDQVIWAEHWYVEDTRRGFSTGLREWLKCSDTELIDLLMHHIRGAKSGHRGTYNRAERLDDRRQMLERWSMFLVRLCEGAEPQKVVSLR